MKVICGLDVEPLITFREGHQKQRDKMKTTFKQVVLIGLGALAASQAFGAFSGDLLLLVENPEGTLTATFNGTPLAVTGTGPDSWTIPNPYPLISGPGAWQEPENNNTYNLLTFNGSAGITVQSDVPIDNAYFAGLQAQYGNAFIFNNGANHWLYHGDAPNGTPGGGGPGSQNVTFNDAVPEPTTIIAGVLMLLPFGLSALRIVRRKALA